MECSGGVLMLRRACAESAPPWAYQPLAENPLPSPAAVSSNRGDPGPPSRDDTVCRQSETRRPCGSCRSLSRDPLPQLGDLFGKRLVEGDGAITLDRPKTDAECLSHSLLGDLGPWLGRRLAMAIATRSACRPLHTGSRKRYLLGSWGSSACPPRSE